VERVLESHGFGPHRVDVVDCPDDEGEGYLLVLVDGVVITEPPLSSRPSFDEVVRLYAGWLSTVASR
jgi:hypothetical protein